ncbi:MAG: VWA domain-containing protein [Polyangiaceae bacterium]|nr:VWA domain-containing protein [Polyangiaceae bacterium]
MALLTLRVRFEVLALVAGVVGCASHAAGPPPSDVTPAPPRASLSRAPAHAPPRSAAADPRRSPPAFEAPARSETEPTDVPAEPPSAAEPQAGADAESDSEDSRVHADGRTADTVTGLRSSALVESNHTVEVDLGHGVARLTVRRDVFNGGGRHDQATFHLQLPEGAVAVGLRTLGTLDGRPHWYAGELLEAELAARRYRELTGIGGYYPKDPALLSWRELGHLALQVFPCPPGETKSVEYTLLVPTRWEGGRHRVELPRLGTRRVAPHVRIVATDSRDALYLGPRRINAGHTVVQRGESLELSLAPAAPAQLEVQLGEQPVKAGQVLRRVDVRAAPRLSAPPRDARVVLVVDASRSLAGDAPAAVAAARHYAAALPEDARVEVITFARRARRLFGAFATAADARARLAALELELANGSAVDEALALADGVLAKETAPAPRRIVLLTDALPRASTTVDALRRKLVRSGALLHVGLPDDAGAALDRDDAHEWAALTRPSGGLVWRARARAADEGDTARRVYEEWVRPIRIHGLEIVQPGLTALEPGDLAEGTAFASFDLEPSASGVITARGELWTQPVSQTVGNDASHTQRWVALLFGGSLVHAIDERDMMPLAVLGRAVSPVTSYLAIEPGVRPSTEGLEWGSGTGIGLGGIGSGGGGHGIHFGKASFDRAAWLREALEPAWRACSSRGGRAEVVVETTYAEVVDARDALPEGRRDASQERCLEEAVWALELPTEFSAARATYRVALGS